MAVDSKERELSVEEILEIAAEETGSQYDSKQVKNYFLKEVMSPNVKTYRYGNTIYMVHPGKTKKNTGTFRALNADTAENYMASGQRFAEDAYASGFKDLVTQFKDQSLINIFRNVSKNPPREGMGYSVQMTDNGNYLVGLRLGKQNGGTEQ
jgi:hypothetical protein